MLWSDFRAADIKTTSFLLAKHEQQGDYNTEREAERLLKMQPEDQDKAVNLPCCNTLSSRLAYRRLLTISRLSVVRGPHAKMSLLGCIHTELIFTQGQKI